MTRVAAYCRVSTDLRDQLNSFESQKLYFQHYIESRPDWTLAEIYADEGITGTTTADRAGFLKMIDDAYQGRFDILLTKEVSRFSRNILDAVSYTRQLKRIGIAVIFLTDGISTLDPDAELRLGIMASVAQEESRKTSERVKWGQRRKMERGIVFGRSLLGYNVRGGVITVEPKGAGTVRTIFDMYVREGLGVRAIAGELTRRGILTSAGNRTWTGASVLKILRNEKYCGDLKQRKNVTADYLTHKITANRDENDMICLQDHHEPIVDREIWVKAQTELSRKSAHNGASPRGSRFCLSGRVICAGCGAALLCRTRKRKDGTTYRVWRLRCSCIGAGRQLREDDVDICVRRFIADAGQDRLLYDFERILKNAGRMDDEVTAAEAEICALEKKSIKLADSYVAGDIGRETYLELKRVYDENLVKLRETHRQLSVTPRQDLTELISLLSPVVTGRDDDSGFYLGLVERVEVRSGGFDTIFKELPGKLNAFYF